MDKNILSLGCPHTIQNRFCALTSTLNYLNSSGNLPDCFFTISTEDLILHIIKLNIVRITRKIVVKKRLFLRQRHADYGPDKLLVVIFQKRVIVLRRINVVQNASVRHRNGRQLRAAARKRALQPVFTGVAQDWVDQRGRNQDRMPRLPVAHGTGERRGYPPA